MADHPVTVEPHLRVGAVAGLTGLSIDTLRYYDRAGLTSPARDSAGQRRYSAADVAELDVIRLLRAAGLTLAEVRAAVEIKRRGGPAETRLVALAEILVRVRAKIDERRVQITEAADAVDGLLAEIAAARR